MSDLPRISIILPFFNARNTLKRALLSIRNQTCRDFECILINNNSADGSSQIAHDFSREDPRFRLINEKKQGVVFASKAGYSKVKGRYICRMDADDWAFPDKLKLQSDFLDRHKEFDVVSGYVEYAGNSGNTSGFARFVDWVNSVQSAEQILLRRFIESPIVNPSVMWRKEVSERFGLYREGDFPEDYELWLRWLDAGVKIAKVPEKVLKWYDYETRLTRNDKRYRKKAFYNLKTAYLVKWLATNNRHHPQVLVWGASRISRSRAVLLEKYGITIVAYIDISAKRKINKEIISYKNIPAAGSIFVLIYISQPNLRIAIQDFLHTAGYNEGSDYLFTG